MKSLLNGMFAALCLGALILTPVFPLAIGIPLAGAFIAPSMTDSPLA
jgi:hypothetical protein